MSILGIFFFPFDTKLPSLVTHHTTIIICCFRSRVEVIISSRPGVGKSLAIQRYAEELSARCLSEDVQRHYVTVPLFEGVVEIDGVVKALLPYEDAANDSDPMIYHIDVSPLVGQMLMFLNIEIKWLQNQTAYGLLKQVCFFLTFVVVALLLFCFVLFFVFVFCFFFCLFVCLFFFHVLFFVVDINVGHLKVGNLILKTRKHIQLLIYFRCI